MTQQQIDKALRIHIIGKYGCDKVKILERSGKRVLVNACGTVRAFEWGTWCDRCTWSWREIKPASQPAPQACPTVKPDRPPPGWEMQGHEGWLIVDRVEKTLQSLDVMPSDQEAILTAIIKMIRPEQKGGKR